MKITKRNYKILKNIIILFPFFELLTFEQLIEKNYNTELWNTVSTTYSLLRILFTGYALAKIKKIPCHISLIGFTLFILIENIVSVVNGTFYINYFVGSLTIIGLILNCEIIMRKSRMEFVETCYVIFGFFSFNELVSIFLWPDGFFNSNIKAYAIYFLGSKNTAFFYYIVFFYFMLYRDLEKYKRPKIKRSGWLVLFILASYISDAANCLLLFTLLLIIYFFWCYAEYMVLHINYKLLVPTLFMVSGFILIDSLREIFTPLFSMLGRDSTFTGRDILWRQAIQFFMRHPFIGNGITTTYVLETGAIANHAHSHFLDILAKYGIFAFSVFIVSIILVIKKYLANSNKQYVVLNSLILGLLLVHSILDHLMIYNFVLVLVAVERLNCNTYSSLAEGQIYNLKQSQNKTVGVKR